VIDGVSNELVATIPTEGFPVVLGCNPEANKVYAAAQYRTFVEVIDGAANQVVDTISVGQDITSMTYCPGGNKVYCSCSYEHFVAVVCGDSNSVARRIQCIPWPVRQCYNPDLNRLYVACGRDSGLIAVVDCALDSLLALLPSPGPGGDARLCYNSVSERLYVFRGCDDSGLVSVIDTRTNQEVLRARVAGIPLDMVWSRNVNRGYAIDYGLYYGRSWILVFGDSLTGQPELRPSDLSRPALAVWPNPCRGRLQVRYQNTPDRPPVRLNLFDVSGRSVADLHLGPNDVTHIAPGVYFVRTVDDSKGSAVRVVVQR